MEIIDNCLSAEMETFQNFISILFEGHSKMVSENEMIANCTCALVRGKSSKIIVDTRTAWDGENLKQGKKNGLVSSDLAFR